MSNGREFGQRFRESNGIPEDYLTIGELARETGFTTEEIKRLIRGGRIKVDLVSSGGRPMRLFEKGIVSKLREMRARAASVVPITSLGSARGQLVAPGGEVAPPVYTKEESAAVFAALRAGKNLVDVVLDSKIDPEVVRHLTKLYTTLDGSVIVLREEVERINQIVAKLPLVGTYPIQSGEHLIELAQSFAERRPCVRCDRNSRSFCEQCFKQHARSALEAGRKEGAEAHARKMRQEQRVSEPVPEEPTPPPPEPPPSSSPYTVARTTRASSRAPA